MSLDLSSQLARYGSQLREDRYELDVEEVVWRGGQPVVGQRRRTSEPRWARPWVVGAAAFLVVVLVGLIQILVDRGGTTEETVPPANSSDLGVFEPMKGQIVYVVDDELNAVDPVDPRVTFIVDVPTTPEGRIGAPPGAAAVVGWSGDGTLLALENQAAGQGYLVDGDGKVTRVPWEVIEGQRGCCVFTGPNWLSPDGTLAVSGAGSEVRILDLLREVAGPSVDLDDPELKDVQENLIAPYMTTWSPDGSQVAFVADRVEGDVLVPTVQLWDIETGDLQQLVDGGFGHIRNMAWAPDGSEILVIAGDYQFPTVPPPSNPLVAPIETDVYLVRIDGSGTRSISNGHFAAAAWSPDGSQIAALDYGSGYHDVIVMNTDGSDEQRVTDHVPGPSGAFTGVSWHPVEQDR